MNSRSVLIAIILIINTLNSFSQIVDNDFKNNQPKENSPLSRFGFGNLSPNYLPNSAGMGGMTAAFRDPYSYNPANPASLSYLRLTAFEVGLYAKTNTISTAKNKKIHGAGGLNHLAIGFPTYSVINEVLDRKPRKVRWAMGLSLMPYNTVGYNIVDSSRKAPNADSISLYNYFLGSGGTYRIMLGNGVAYKGFSIGANIGYVFGKMNYFRQTEFSPNLGVSYGNNFEDYYTVRGLTWNAGMQYDITLDPKSKYGDKGDRKHIVIGAYGKPSTDFTTSSSSYYRRVLSNLPNVRPDTLQFTSDVDGKGVLPTEFTGGLMYEDGLKLKIGAEYSTAKWSEYKNDARPETLKDASTLTFGAEFILNKSKLKNEEEKIRWRVGYRNAKDPRSLNGQQLSNNAFTAGMVLPMRVNRGQLISYLNLGLEYGKLGTSALKESYFRLNVGFTLNDNTWFLKRKFQ